MHTHTHTHTHTSQAFLLYQRDALSSDVDDAAWRDVQAPTRQRAGLARALLRYEALSWVVLSDCEGVWLGDALAYARAAASAAAAAEADGGGGAALDVLVAGAHLTPGSAVNDSGLEPPTARVTAAGLDAGLVFFRRTPRALAFADAWAAALRAGAAQLDGHALGDVAFAGYAAPPDAPPPSLALVEPRRTPTGAVVSSPIKLRPPPPPPPSSPSPSPAAATAVPSPSPAAAAAAARSSAPAAAAAAAAAAPKSTLPKPVAVALPAAAATQKGGGGLPSPSPASSAPPAAAAASGAGAGTGGKPAAAVALSAAKAAPKAAAAPAAAADKGRRALLAAAAAAAAAPGKAQGGPAPKPSPAPSAAAAAAAAAAERRQPAKGMIDPLAGGGGADGEQQQEQQQPQPKQGSGTDSAAAAAVAAAKFDMLAAATASGLPPIAPPSPSSRVVAAWHGRAALGVLPLWLFPNGHAYWVQRLHELPGAPRPLVVRNTHTFGGLAAKRHRLREAGLFADGPGYYHDAASRAPKYVSFDLPLAPDLSAADFAALPPDRMRAFHAKALALQLEQLWQGMALAVALGRVLVLPRFACYCDRHWTRLERCRVPGAEMARLPFACPLDHVLAPDRFDDAGSELVVAVREAGALENPRAPPELRRGTLVITPKRGLALPVEVWRAGAGAVGLHLPRDLGQGVLRAYLAPYEHFPVWHFRSPVHVLSAFDSPQQAAAFRRRVEHLRPLL